MPKAIVGIKMPNHRRNPIVRQTRHKIRLCIAKNVRDAASDI
jgi:hypothetical protein